MAAISYEAALDACKKRLGDLTYELVLREARIADLEAQLAAQRSGQTPPGPAVEAGTDRVPEDSPSAV